MLYPDPVPADADRATGVGVLAMAVDRDALAVCPLSGPNSRLAVAAGVSGPVEVVDPIVAARAAPAAPPGEI